MSTESAAASPLAAPADPPDEAGDGFEPGIAQRPDGVYADLSLCGPRFVAAVDAIFSSERYFTGLNYAALIKALFDHDAATAEAGGWLRVADGIAPFDPARRALYRSVRISDGQAEYYFEPVFLADPDQPQGPGRPARLDFDEFVADMWLKGVRFGVDEQAVRGAIEQGQSGRMTVAYRRAPTAGEEARVIEVSDDIRRSDAPRQLANGKLDLMSFQNRFPQVRQGERLLKKLPRTAGAPGFELSGIVLEPAMPNDLELAAFCGPGTDVERGGEGEFLVAQRSGFLSVDGQTSKLSVDDKIVSRDGVSAKTTGNLQLEGDFEEFGEVQEQRVIEGEGIIVHADVYGHIVSRGGSILLHHNLVGGSARNRAGDIRVLGVASNAVIQTSSGEVVLERAEQCVVSGTRVTIAQAINCEIIGETVAVGQAQGCAIAGLSVDIGSAAPRRQTEMTVLAMYPDCSAIDAAIVAARQRAQECALQASAHKGSLEQISSQPELRRYLQLATRLRKNELALTAEQAVQFRKFGESVAPSLKELARLNVALKTNESEQQAALEQLAQLMRQRGEQAALSTVRIGEVQGDTQVRAAPFAPDGRGMFDLPAREIRTRLRAPASGQVLFAGADGAFEWSSAPAAD